MKKNHLIVRLVQEMLQFPLLFVSSSLLLFISTVLTLMRPLLIAWLLNQPPNSDAGLWNKGILMLLLLLTLESILSYFTSYSISRLGQEIIFKLRNRLYSHLLNLSTRTYDTTPVGTLITRCVSDIEAMNEIFSQGLLQITGDVLMIILLLGAMIYKNIWLSASVLAILPLLLLSTSLFRKGVKKSFQQVRDAVAALNVFIQERLQGMYLIRLFNVQQREMEKFKELNQHHKEANIKAIFYYSVFFPVMDILTSVSFALLMFIGFNLKSSGKVGLGDLTFFIMVTQMLFRPIRILADRVNILQMGLVAADRIYKVLNNTSSLEKNGTTEIHDFRQAISFRNVSFSYTEGKPVLQNISFTLPKGRKLALIGRSGSGKSTIALLLSAHYSNYEGNIFIDQFEISTLNKASLRKNVFIIMQDVFLFNDTLLENIRFYNKAISREYIYEEVREMELEPFIDGFPGRLDYVIRERGSGLSAGQKQLVAFLRARLLNPSVLIMDEATSFMDAQTEHLIQQAMKKILQNKTAIIIAHRLSTVMHCDDILVMEKGKIAEYGPLRTLLNKPDSLFRKYLNTTLLS